MDIRVLVGSQEAKGTAKTTDLKVLNATGFEIKPEVNKIESKVLGTGRWTKDSIAGKLSVSGDLPLEPTLDELYLMLEAGGFKKQNESYIPGEFSKYLTLINDFHSDNMHLIYKDCLINSMELNIQQEAYVNLKCNVIGMANEVKDKECVQDNCITKETKKAGQLLCFGATIYENENEDKSADVQGVTLSINNSLEGRGGLNSKFNTKILQNGRGSVELTVEFNSFDKTNYAKAMQLLTNNETLKMKIKLTDAKKSVEIIMPKIKLTNVELGDLEGVGTITRTFAVLPDEKDCPVEFKVTEETAVAGSESH